MAVYVFDLDQTLCITKWSKDEERWLYESAEPIWDRIKIVNKLYYQGHEIVIDTARGHDSGKDWFGLTEKQLLEWGLKWSRLRCGVKIPADYYVDDSAIDAEVFFSV